MGRRKKMIERQPLLSPRATQVQEPRASIAATVSWLLTILVTGGSFLLAGIFFWLGRAAELAPQSARLFSFFSSMLLLTAAVTGILCLALTVAVYRIRSDRPPLAITVTAVFVSALPLATMLLLAMRG